MSDHNEHEKQTQDQEDNKFLVDPENADASLQYVVPNVDVKLPSAKRLECRKIVREIKDFGLNQRQVLYLVYLLSLELENRETMLALTKVVGEHRENFPVSKLIVSEDD